MVVTLIPEFGGRSLLPESGESGGIFFTPSNTARQNYLYLQYAGCVAADESYSAEQRRTESYLLVYTYSGKGELTYNDRHYFVGPNEGFLIDCRQNYSYRCASEEAWEFVWFNMDGVNMGAYYGQFAAARKPVFRAAEGSDLESQVRRLGRCAATKGTPQNELIASAAITCILTDLIVDDSMVETDRRATPGYISGIMERINADYARQITLDSLAQEFNVSKYHLSREFKKYTGYSPNEYVIAVRINRAKELLRCSTHTVGEIAQLTGCGDVNHFIQLFKSREKTTPAAFRKRWRDR